MRELKELITDKTEVRQEAPKQIKKVLAGKITPGDGHKIWSCNILTLEVEQVEIDKTQPKEITAKADTIYCSALNLKNAERKFAKFILKLL